MALSNIFREPRREITESMVGISFFAVIGVAIHFLATWLMSFSNHDPVRYWGDLSLAYFTALVLLLVVWGLLVWTHSVGDSICDFFQERGLYLRPRVRK